MTLTTTQSVEGRTIVEYKEIVFGEVISGVNFLKDLEVLGEGGGMLMVTASGTAVRLG